MAKKLIKKAPSTATIGFEADSGKEHFDTFHHVKYPDPAPTTQVEFCCTEETRCHRVLASHA
jgi:hypothetical protein